MPSRSKGRGGWSSGQACVLWHTLLSTKGKDEHGYSAIPYRGLCGSCVHHQRVTSYRGSIKGWVRIVHQERNLTAAFFPMGSNKGRPRILKVIWLRACTFKTWRYSSAFVLLCKQILFHNKALSQPPFLSRDVSSRHCFCALGWGKLLLLKM